MTKSKNLFLRVMSWSLRLTGRNLEIAEKNMTRLMLNSDRNFEPGDKVLALLPIPGRPLQARYYGPYTVTKS